MSDGVLITLIICVTLVLLSIIDLKYEHKDDKKDDKKDDINNECKYPTLPPLLHP